MGSKNCKTDSYKILIILSFLKKNLADSVVSMYNCQTWLAIIIMGLQVAE